MSFNATASRAFLGPFNCIGLAQSYPLGSVKVFVIDSQLIERS